MDYPSLGRCLPPDGGWRDLCSEFEARRVTWETPRCRTQLRTRPCTPVCAFEDLLDKFLVSTTTKVSCGSRTPPAQDDYHRYHLARGYSPPQVTQDRWTTLLFKTDCTLFKSHTNSFDCENSAGFFLSCVFYSPRVNHVTQRQCLSEISSQHFQQKQMPELLQAQRITFAERRRLKSGEQLTCHTCNYCLCKLY